MLHAHPAVLRFNQRQIQILDGAVLLPHARLEGLIQMKESTPFTSRSRSRYSSVSLPGGALASSPSMRWICAHCARSSGEPRAATSASAATEFEAAGELLAPALQLIGRAGREQRIGARQALGVGAFARIDHVAQGFHASGPVLEGVAEIDQIAIVLQALLEIVACEHRIQVARLGRLRQALELPEPAVVLALLLVEDGIEHRAVANAADGQIQPAILGVEGFERALVVLRRLSVRRELAEGIGHGEVGLLDRGIQKIAVAQLKPRGERAAIVTERRIRPAGAEERLVRIGALQAHAPEYRQRLLRLLGLHIGKAERKIGAIFESEELLLIRASVPTALNTGSASPRRPARMSATPRLKRA
jgi:hypothetical protein